MSGVDVGDIADAAVTALTSPGHEGRTIPLVGPDLLTGPTVASTYAKHLGHAVRYGGDDLIRWMDSVAEHMPGWLVADLRAMFDHFLRHGLRATDDDREASAVYSAASPGGSTTSRRPWRRRSRRAARGIDRVRRAGPPGTLMQ